MSDRDRFVDVSYKLLQNDDLLGDDKQFWIEYLLRWLRKQKDEKYFLGDVLDWKFTGDNGIVFTPDELTIPNDYMSIDQSWDVTTLELSTGARVDSILVDADYIYICGTFTTINGVDANHIAMYNILTGEFSALGGGINFDTPPSGTAAVTSLCIDKWNSYLWAAGYSFSSTDGYSGQDVRYWDGSTWHDVADSGVTLAGIVDMFAVDEYIYMVGYSDTYVHIYNADAGTWQNISLPGTAYFYAQSIVVDSTGIIYVGGTYHYSTFHYIAAYYGGSWHDMGSTLTDTVRSLSIDSDDKLYVFGEFSGKGKIYYNNAWHNITGLYYDAISSTIKTSNNNCYVLFSDWLGYWNGQAMTYLSTGSDFSTDQSAYGRKVEIGDYVGDVWVVGNDFLANYVFPSPDFLLGYTPEDQALKSTDGTMIADSDNLYPSQSAVRTYAPKKVVTTSTPTVNDDISLEYRVGDIWIDTDG